MELDMPEQQYAVWLGEREKIIYVFGSRLEIRKEDGVAILYDNSGEIAAATKGNQYVIARKTADTRRTSGEESSQVSS